MKDDKYKKCFFPLENSMGIYQRKRQRYKTLYLINFQYNQIDTIYSRYCDSRFKGNSK